MKTKILLTITCFIAITTFGQAKKFTLEESVLQQNRQFRADKLIGFQWIPNTNNYTYYTDSGKKVVTASATNSKTTELVSLTDLNKTLNSNFKSFTTLEWKDASTFIVFNENAYYS